MFASVVHVYILWPHVDLSVKHNRPTRSFTRTIVNLDTQLLFTASGKVLMMCRHVNKVLVNTFPCKTTVNMLNSQTPALLYLYKVVYILTVLTPRPYAPLILLLRCQSNFLAIRMECAELWNRCVCVLQAASCGALADRVCGGYDNPNVCIDPSFLPPVLVNRWSDGRQATGLRGKEAVKKRG